jgi:hypothetical protein
VLYHVEIAFLRVSRLVYFERRYKLLKRVAEIKSPLFGELEAQAVSELLLELILGGCVEALR